MADTTKLKALPIRALQELEDAMNKSFTKELGTENFYQEGTTTWSIPEVGYTSTNTDSEHLRDYVASITDGITDMRQAFAVVDKELQDKLSGRSQAAEANRPSKEQLETLEAENAKREAARKQAIQESKKAVQDAIDKKVALRNEAAKLKPSYVKAEYTKPETNSEVEAFKSEAQNSEKLYPILKDKVKETIIKSVPGVSEADAELLSTKTAYTLIDSANNPEKYIQLAQQQAILENVSTNAAIPADVRAAASDEAVFLNLQTQAARTITAAINPRLANLIPSSGNFSVSFSPEHLEGFDLQFNPVGLTDGYQGLLTSQLQFFNGLINLPFEKIQGELMSKASQAIESQIAKNFPQLIGAFNSEGANLLLSGLGFGNIAIELPAAFSETVTATPGLLNLMNFGGSFLGVSFKTGAAAAVNAPTSIAAIQGGTAIAAGGEAAAGLAGSTAVAVGAEAGATTVAAAGVAAAPATAGLSLVATVAVAVVGKKAFSGIVKFAKDNAQKASKGIVATVGGLAVGGIAIASGLGVAAGLFYGILGGGGTYAAASFLSGGTAGMSAALSGLGSGILGVFDVIWATFLAGVAGPIIAILIGFPVVVALILFIINSGAYVVPPGTQLTNSTNLYISVDKTANPSKADSPTSVTYTVSIAAKKDSLSGISIVANCTARKKGGTLNCPSEQIPSPPASIAAGSPFTFTFTSNYGPEFQDALISDEIKVNATSISGGKVTETGSASVCFGKCPLDCYDFSDPSWNAVPSIKSQFTNAAALISGQYSEFSKKACLAGPIKMVYSSNDPVPGSCGNLYGRNISNSQINFNKCASQVGGQEGVNYIFTHEITHHIQYTNGHWFTLYLDKVPAGDKQICTYGQGDPSEQMAEADALFVANASSIYTDPCGVSKANFQSMYPVKYNFVKNYMYGTQQ